MIQALQRIGLAPRFPIARLCRHVPQHFRLKLPLHGQDCLHPLRRYCLGCPSRSFHHRDCPCRHFRFRHSREHRHCRARRRCHCRNYCCHRNCRSRRNFPFRRHCHSHRRALRRQSRMTSADRRQHHCRSATGPVRRWPRFQLPSRRNATSASSGLPSLTAEAVRMGANDFIRLCIRARSSEYLGNPRTRVE